MSIITRHLSLPTPQGKLSALLTRPEAARALILMAQTGPHPAHPLVAATLAARNFAILAVDLLTEQETRFHEHQEDVALHAGRLIATLDFIRHDGDTENLMVGLYTSDHASPAAIRAAAQRDATIRAVVVCGGLIDRAGLQYLEALVAPLLVLVDPEDEATRTASERAFKHLAAVHEMHPVESAAVAPKTSAWFDLWLR